MKKLILGVTGPGSSRLLDGQVNYFQSKGYQVFLLSPDHPKEHKFCAREGCHHLPVAIAKEISPLRDLQSLLQIIRHLKNVKPDIVNVGTPKMGLLAILGCYFLRIQNRIYTCRGLRYESERGFKKWILVTMELLTVTLANKVIYVGHSVFKAAQKNGTARVYKSEVIAEGSSNGVDLNYFNRDNVDNKNREELMVTYDLHNKFVIGYVGRVSAHKGSYELVEAFENLFSSNNNLRLILIGHLDCSPDLERRVRSHPGIIYLAFLDNVPLYMSLFDIFVLPSWREGFSNASIQAAAMGLPVITSDATGCSDAVQPEFNGYVFAMRSVEQLTDRILMYIRDEKLRVLHSSNSKLWAQKFRRELIWEGIEKVYQNKIPAAR